MTLADIEKKFKKGIAFRSCWKCNSAHKHLKKEKDFVIYCFECGKLYLNGKEIILEEIE